MDKKIKEDQARCRVVNVNVKVVFGKTKCFLTSCQTLDLLHKRRRWLQLRPRGSPPPPPPPPPPRHRHRRQEVLLRLFQEEAPRHLHHRGQPPPPLILAALEVHRLK